MVYEDDIEKGSRSIWLPRPAVSIDTLEYRRLLDSVWTLRDDFDVLSVRRGQVGVSDKKGLGLGGGMISFRRGWRVTFTPVSENAERALALIDLVRLETQDTGLKSERDDTFSYEAKDKLKARREIIAPLKRSYRMLA